MNTEIPVLKEINKELPVPSVWRQSFKEIVQAFETSDFELNTNSLNSVDTLKPKDAERIATNIHDYGDLLAPLSEKTWEHSIYIWRDDYWDVLIDLSTLEQGISDLVLFVKVTESTGDYRFTVEDVHVP